MESIHPLKYKYFVEGYLDSWVKDDIAIIIASAGNGSGLPFNDVKRFYNDVLGKTNLNIKYYDFHSYCIDNKIRYKFKIWFKTNKYYPSKVVFVKNEVVKTFEKLHIFKICNYEIDKVFYIKEKYYV